MLYLTLYKDLYNAGFNKLYSQINFLNIYNKPMKINIKKTRAVLYSFEKQYIEVGTVGEWNKKIRKVKIGNKISDANLIIDSVDLNIVGKSKTSNKDSSWSYKTMHQHRGIW